MKRLSLVVACLVLAPALVQAQNIEAALLYATLSGDDFDGVDAGLGIDAQVRFRAGPRLTIGIGGQYTMHGVDISDEKFKVMGIFAEPRLTFSMPGASMTPFVGARLGYLRNSFSDTGTDVKASGWLLGGTGGLMFRAGPSMNIVLALMFASATFGDQEINGTTQANTDASGTSLALRAGVSFGF